MKKWISYLLIFILWSLALAFVLTPSLRHSLRSFFYTPQRKVLSTATADLLNNGTLYKVLKIQEGSRLYIEIYSLSDMGSHSLLERLPLPKNHHDGYFHIQGLATNLALKNIDDDPFMEILVPTYDASQKAHLNIFKYNPQEKKFFPFTPPPSS